MVGACGLTPVRRAGIIDVRLSDNQTSPHHQPKLSQRIPAARGGFFRRREGETPMTVQMQDAAAQRPDQPLAWGRHYAMVRPDHFRVDYLINPYMDLDRQPDPDRAMDQWRGLVAAIEEAGGRVDVLE